MKVLDQISKQYKLDIVEYSNIILIEKIYGDKDFTKSIINKIIKENENNKSIIIEEYQNMNWFKEFGFKEDVRKVVTVSGNEILVNFLVREGK